MTIQLDSGSRFQFTTPIIMTTPSGDVIETFGSWVPPSFITTRPDNSLIGKFQVQGGDAGRPDNIAYKLYGSQYLDWILIAFNKVQNVYGWPAAGAIIEYPLAQLVFAEVD